MKRHGERTPFVQTLRATRSACRLGRTICPILHNHRPGHLSRNRAKVISEVDKWKERQLSETVIPVEMMREHQNIWRGCSRSFMMVMAGVISGSQLSSPRNLPSARSLHAIRAPRAHITV